MFGRLSALRVSETDNCLGAQAKTYVGSANADARVNEDSGPAKPTGHHPPRSERTVPVREAPEHLMSVAEMQHRLKTSAGFEICALCNQTVEPFQHGRSYQLEAKSPRRDDGLGQAVKTRVANVLIAHLARFGR